jgi:hypothetical protein
VIGQTSAVPRVNDKAGVIRILVKVLLIDRKHLAHVHAETITQNLIRSAHRSVICNQQQRATAVYPVTDGIAFRVSKRRVRGLCRIHLRGAQRIRNHQKVEAFERVSGKLLFVRRDPVTVIRNQISKRLVTAARGVKVIVRFIEQDLWSVL